MSRRTLHEVLVEAIGATHRYPAIRRTVFDVLFDEAKGLHPGMVELESQLVQREGTDLTLHTHELWPSTWLLMFSAAVSNGVVPEMALPDGV